MNRRTTLIALLVTICSTTITQYAVGQERWIDKLFKKSSTETTAEEHPELPELTVDENLLIPELTDKQATQARKIQKREADRLQENKLNVELIRDNEVIKVTIPSSQLFAPNTTKLLDSSDKVLRALLPCLRTPDYYHILLVMHSDNTGNEEYNYALTTERVFAIYDWFEGNGGCVEYVVPYAAGSFEPTKPNNTVTGRNANRRLEVYIIPAEAMFAKK